MKTLKLIEKEKEILFYILNNAEVNICSRCDQNDVHDLEALNLIKKLKTVLNKKS